MVFPSLSRTGTHRICTTRNTQRPGRSTTAVPGGGELLQCVPTMRSAVDGVHSTVGPGDETDEAARPHRARLVPTLGVGGLRGPRGAQPEVIRAI